MAPMGVKSSSPGSPRVRPMGVHRTRGEASLTKSRKRPTRKALPLVSVTRSIRDKWDSINVDGDQYITLEEMYVLLSTLPSRRCTHAACEPFNSTPDGGQLHIARPARLRVRCTPMGRTCRWARGTTTKTQPGSIAAPLVILRYAAQLFDLADKDNEGTRHAAGRSIPTQWGSIRLQRSSARPPHGARAW